MDCQQVHVHRHQLLAASAQHLQRESRRKTAEHLYDYKQSTRSQMWWSLSLAGVIGASTLLCGYSFLQRSRKLWRVLPGMVPLQFGFGIIAFQKNKNHAAAAERHYSSACMMRQLSRSTEDFVGELRDQVPSESSCIAAEKHLISLELGFASLDYGTTSREAQEFAMFLLDEEEG